MSGRPQVHIVPGVLVGPGDTLVLTVEAEGHTAESVQDLRDQIQDRLPDVEVLVIAGVDVARVAAVPPGVEVAGLRLLACPVFAEHPEHPWTIPGAGVYLRCGGRQRAAEPVLEPGPEPASRSAE